MVRSKRSKQRSKIETRPRSNKVEQKQRCGRSKQREVKQKQGEIEQKQGKVEQVQRWGRISTRARSNNYKIKIEFKRKSEIKTKARIESMTRTRTGSRTRMARVWYQEQGREWVQCQNKDKNEINIKYKNEEIRIREKGLNHLMYSYSSPVVAVLDQELKKWQLVRQENANLHCQHKEQREMNEHILSLQDKGKEESKKRQGSKVRVRPLGRKLIPVITVERGIMTRRIVGREWEKCFRCGSLEHKLKSCPRYL